MCVSLAVVVPAACRLFLGLSCVVTVGGLALYSKAGRIFHVITHSDVVTVELDNAEAAADNWGYDCSVPPIAVTVHTQRLMVHSCAWGDKHSVTVMATSVLMPSTHQRGEALCVRGQVMTKIFR